MADVLEEVVRVGLAGWVGESDDQWDTPQVLGVIGDDLYLVEIDGNNRERVLLELVDRYEVADRNQADIMRSALIVPHEESLRIEIVLFGNAGGFFASSMSFLDLWPKSPADVPADVFVDNRYKAAFTKADDEIVMTVRHALRPSDGPPKRRFRFSPNKYQEAMSDLARESRRLRDDLIAVAQQHAPEKVASLQEAFKHWPA